VFRLQCITACACWAGGAVETGAAPPPVGRRAVASFVDSLTGSPPVGTGRRPRRGRTRMRPPRRCPLFPRRRPPSEPPPQCGGVAELPASPFILINLVRWSYQMSCPQVGDGVTGITTAHGAYVH